jgi:hypothetical protein
MRYRRFALCGAFLLLALAAPSMPDGRAAPETGGKVSLQDVKYDDLGKLVRSLKGKVVVVDFWGEY